MSTPAALYARAIRSSVNRSRGDNLPAIELTEHDVAIDPGELAAYARVCGFGISDVVPPTYPHVLAFAQALEIQTDPRFPLPAIGTVHVAQEITVRRPIKVTDELVLRTFATDLRPHARGRQYDMVTVASADGEDIWTGRSTYLHREAGDGTRANGPKDERSEARPPQATATWRLDAKLGRSYASASGDWNPIHLYRVSARLFGFKRQIAHGMWTYAACIAALQGRLPDAYTVTAQFKRPIFLPSKVDFAAGRTGKGWTFAVHEHAGTRPHVVGDVSALSHE